MQQASRLVDEALLEVAVSCAWGHSGQPVPPLAVGKTLNGCQTGQAEVRMGFVNGDLARQPRLRSGFPNHHF